MKRSVTDGIGCSVKAIFPQDRHCGERLLKRGQRQIRGFGRRTLSSPIRTQVDLGRHERESDVGLTAMFRDPVLVIEESHVTPPMLATPVLITSSSASPRSSEFEFHTTPHLCVRITCVRLPEVLPQQQLLS